MEMHTSHTHIQKHYIMPTKLGLTSDRRCLVYFLKIISLSGLVLLRKGTFVKTEIRFVIK